MFKAVRIWLICAGIGSIAILCTGCGKPQDIYLTRDFSGIQLITIQPGSLIWNHNSVGTLVQVAGVGTVCATEILPTNTLYGVDTRFQLSANSSFTLALNANSTLQNGIIFTGKYDSNSQLTASVSLGGNTQDITSILTQNDSALVFSDVVLAFFIDNRTAGTTRFLIWNDHSTTATSFDLPGTANQPLIFDSNQVSDFDWTPPAGTHWGITLQGATLTKLSRLNSDAVTGI